MLKFGIRADFFEDVKTAYHRHHQIEQQHVRVFADNQFHGLSRFADRDKVLVAGLFQVGLHHIHGDGFIIDHHHRGRSQNFGIRLLSEGGDGLFRHGRRWCGNVTDGHIIYS